MGRRPTAVVALVVLLALAGCSVGYQPTTPDGTAPPNADRLGQYDGVSHDATFDVNASAGLTAAQREAVFDRAMARVQLLRGLRFQEDVDVRLVTRETYREEYGNVTTPTPPEDVRTLDNAQHEALFLVSSDEDVYEVRTANRGESVLGFYQPGTDRLTLVSDGAPARLPTERTLAHELVHALQDQRFGLGSLAGETLDGENARRGLIEGSATVVGREYVRNCETGEWQCVGSGARTIRDGGSEFNFGVYFVGFFPYAEGPSFVEHHRDRGGWDAIDAMHADPPNASAEIIHPSRYGDDDGDRATVEDRNDATWERVRTEQGDYATVGQAGLASMFAYTAFEFPERGVVDPADFENVGEDGRLDDRRPYTYDLAYADGWAGDRLHAYENGGETAVVWNVTFRDEANATEFQEGYRRVVEFWGGERHGQRSGGTAWTLVESERFRGAVWLERDDDSVTVVKAPSVEALDDVYAPAG